LPSQITEGLNELAKLDASAKIAELDRQIEETRNGSLPQEIKESVIAAFIEQKQSLADGIDVVAVEADIYNHLTNFFSRYYDNGDFISQRRYKDGVYAIPYEGEEVKLHWANADQYYVKTSEYFKDYTFKTPYGDKIHFKLIEADVERDNNKPDEKRFFQLYQEKPFEVVNEELFIYMEYKASELNKSRTQDSKIQETHRLEIVDAFTNVQSETEFQPFATILNQSDGKSELERQLNRYTARNTFDYFIHKDLKKFLERELDFYIKNDVIFLDDIDEQDEGKTKEYLTKAKVIRKIAKKIITFLAQIEDFQKKLYLKKKFVVETNYCITLDRVPVEMYPEIAANEAQREEWVNLFAIDEIEAVDGNLLNDGKVAYSVPLTVDFLKQNPFLVVDTAFFTNSFKEQLVASMDGLDEKINGLLIHSENSQALRLLDGKYQRGIDGIYIDPPYNTNASPIIYKNGYKDSSWLSLMQTRYELANKLVTRRAFITTAIDHAEIYNLGNLLDGIYSDYNRIVLITVEHNPKGRNQAKFFSENTEYLLVYAVDKDEATLNNIAIDDDVISTFSEQDEEGRFRWEEYIRARTVWSRAARPDNWYPIYVSPDLSTITSEKAEGYHVLFPRTNTGDFSWKNVRDTFDSLNKDGYFKAEMIDGKVVLFHKYREKQVLKNLWAEKKYHSEFNGTNLLKDLFGIAELFSNPKSIHAVEDMVKLTIPSSGVIIDYFAGSGTTAHAVINLNYADGGNRKYILVEMGEYFHIVTKPRVEKVIYSDKWKDGKPQANGEGGSHAFKYIYLESFEDTLNNIALNSGNYDMFAEASEGYFLSYMLDKEAERSISMLNVEMLDKPFSYKMNITRNLECIEHNVDLVETFNYLIGLMVNKSHALVSFDADFTVGEYGAISAVLKSGDTFRFKAVEGAVPNGDKTLIIWREMTGDTIKDNAALDAYFLSIPSARSFKRIYVNCDNNLMNLRNKGESWQVDLIDEEMKKRMFEGTE